MNIGKVIREKRKELGITQEELAKLCGVAGPTVSRWETGDIGNMRRDRIYKLAVALQLSPAEIMGITETDLRAFDAGDLLAMASQDPEIIDIIKIYQNLPRGDRKRLVEFARALDTTAK